MNVNLYVIFVLLVIYEKLECYSLTQMQINIITLTLFTPIKIECEIKSRSRGNQQISAIYNQNNQIVFHMSTT